MAKPEPKNSKIKVLHLINSLITGGAEIAMLHYIQALGWEDYDHYVYSFGKDGPVRLKIETMGIRVHFGPQRISIKNPFKFCISIQSLVKDLLKFLRARNIDVIHSHLGQPNQLAVIISKMSGTPVFPTIHSTNAFEDARSRWDPRVYLIRIINSIIYRMADRVVIVSPEIRDIIKKTYRLDDAKLVVLKNGIIISNKFSQNPPDRQISANSNVVIRIIAVGRLVQLKCFDTLVKASAKIIQQGKADLIVQIVGDGEDRMQLESLIADLGVGNSVKLLGIRDDVIELMRDADIFVIPSSYEGLSIAMIEAMACGLPIIGSDAPGIREFINHENNGLLFKIKDHRALADCIHQLVSDGKLRTYLSYAARKSFEKEYDMRKNIIPLDLLFREYAAASFDEQSFQRCPRL